MANRPEQKTDRGVFRQDPSGLWHYQQTKSNGIVDDAVHDALKHRPDGTAWFWFNGTPVPIYKGDDQDGLKGRWSRWRSEWHENAKNLCESLEALSGGRHGSIPIPE